MIGQYFEPQRIFKPALLTNALVLSFIFELVPANQLENNKCCETFKMQDTYSMCLDHLFIYSYGSMAQYDLHGIMLPVYNTILLHHIVKMQCYLMEMIFTGFKSLP
jgi:hypothetical protein